MLFLVCSFIESYHPKLQFIPIALGYYLRKERLLSRPCCLRNDWRRRRANRLKCKNPFERSESRGRPVPLQLQSFLLIINYVLYNKSVQYFCP